MGAMRLPPVINNQTRTPFKLPGNLASKLLSPSNLRGRPSASGFQPTMTNPQRTRPNSGIKPLAQVGKPRKSISEMDALSCWNAPDARGPRLEANLRYSIKSRCQKMSWQGGMERYARRHWNFTMNATLIPIETSKRPLRRLAAGAFHRPSREKQIPFRKVQECSSGEADRSSRYSR